MKEYYTINEVAVMTGFTTRSLRLLIQQGFLEGEKIDGKWNFTVEQLEAFISNPNIKAGIKIKNNALVYDFLADFEKKENQTCLIQDFHISSNEEFEEISSYFCTAMSDENVSASKMKLERQNNSVRLILSGPEDFIADVMKKWYEKK